MNKKRVVIIGGGITGLSAAYYLQKQVKSAMLPIEIALVEGSDRLGGRIHTIKKDGFTIEKGPDSLLARKPAAMELAEELGILDQTKRNSTGQSFMLLKSKLHKMPKGAFMGVPKEIGPLLRSKSFTLTGKIRALMDLVMPKKKNTEDESLGHFMRRRFGDQIVDNQIDPLLSGIHSGDIDQMSLQAIYPIFGRMEQEYGSVMKGLSKTMPKPEKNKNAKTTQGQFFSFTNGLQTLVDTLEAKLDAVEIIRENKVNHIEKKAAGYHLLLDSGEVLTADFVLLAVPHTQVPGMLSKHQPLQELFDIPATSTANVVLAFDEKQIKRDLDGTGFLVTRNSNYRITACTWTHRKWEGTAPEGKALLRCYVGKPDDQDIVNETDETLVDIVIKDLNKVMKIKGQPLFYEITRFVDARPQYHTGHLELVSRIRDYVTHQLPGLALIGSSYDGTGIPDCIEHGQKGAALALQALTENK
ncbi:protoporphyrinogen oxidase [Oceanobacillus sp. CFH 90083]|uniref:protoporphyrinogen oxidase n=1 Tax=Oceanobacillus sp. CFH 90083 TaxID=2592336 RepID=UPI00128CC5B9|nr:protoporphyrinogen oxidase [Oceanobacillus sp. CFH 90083]